MTNCNSLIAFIQQNIKELLYSHLVLDEEWVFVEFLPTNSLFLRVLDHPLYQFLYFSMNGELLLWTLNWLIFCSL